MNIKIDLIWLTYMNIQPLNLYECKEQKYVISKNKKPYSLIEKTGITNLTAEQLRVLVETFFKL